MNFAFNLLSRLLLPVLILTFNANKQYCSKRKYGENPDFVRVFSGSLAMILGCGSSTHKLTSACEKSTFLLLNRKSRARTYPVHLLPYQKGPTNLDKQYTIQTDTIASNLLTLSDAEKIMGEDAKLTGNSFVKKGDTLEYKCDYSAISKDAIASKTGQLYFMYEVYSEVSAAANAYAAIYQANNKHEGIKVVSGLADEAYYHSDQTGFYFCLVRKIKN